MQNQINSSVELEQSNQPTNPTRINIEESIANLQSTINTIKPIIKALVNTAEEMQDNNLQLSKTVDVLKETLNTTMEENKKLKSELAQKQSESEQNKSELEELVKSHNITVEKVKAASKETEIVLKESQHTRLMSDLMDFHHEKEIASNNKSIQASTDNIYKKISIINATLDGKEIDAIGSVKEDSALNPHRLFTKEGSCASQYAGHNPTSSDTITSMSY